MNGDSSADDFHRKVIEGLPRFGTVLDVGCGRGAHLAKTDAAEQLQALRARGGTIIGIDVALPDEGNPIVTELRHIASEGTWPVESNSIDLAYCDWVLEHVTDPQQFFSECGRVLKPGGVFIARTMQAWSVAGVGARLVPDRLHTPMIKRLQPHMNSTDIFPTALKCNTRRSLTQLFETTGMRLASYTTHNTLHGYGAGKPWLERILVQLEKRLPEGSRHGIVVSATRVPI